MFSYFILAAEAKQLYHQPLFWLVFLEFCDCYSPAFFQGEKGSFLMFNSLQCCTIFFLYILSSILSVRRCRAFWGKHLPTLLALLLLQYAKEVEALYLVFHTSETK